MKTLITGTKRGLGNFLSNLIPCDCLTRETSVDTFKNNVYDVVIHCAADSKNTIRQSELNSYLNDNIFLIKDLLKKIQCERFIFISSISVYPLIYEKIEGMEINIDEIPNIYGKTKLISEELVKSNHKNYLIFRCPHIIGLNRLPNSIYSMVNNSNTTLSENSFVNYILQSDVYNVIQEFLSLDTPINKVINVASSVGLSLNRMPAILNKKITFGNYHIDSGNINVNELKNTFPKINIDSSLNNIISILKIKQMV